MSKKDIKYGLIIIIVFCGMLPVLAQNDWEETNTNELEDVQVEIVKEREITLPKATRNFEKIPPQPIDKKEEVLEYTFQNLTFDVPPLDVKLKPLKVKPETLDKLYGGFIKAGFGNYTTPYAEGFFTNKRDKQYNYGVHLKHLSSRNGPVDEQNSGTGESLAEAYGKFFGRKITVGTGLGYAFRNNHYYGYNTPVAPEAGDIEHNFNQFDFNASASSVDTPIEYRVDFDYNHISDNAFLKENEAEIGLKLNTGVGEQGAIEVLGGFDYVNQSDSSYTGHNRILAYLQPQYKFNLSGVAFAAGVNVTYADDTLGKLSKFRVYPAIEVKYGISDKAEILFSFTGATIKQNYRALSSENAFIAPENKVFYTNNQYTLRVQGSVSAGPKTQAKAGIEYGRFKNSLFYTNSTTNPAQFELSYDTGSISILNLYGEFAFIHQNRAQVVLRGDYYSYGMDVLQEAWHRPQYKIGLLSNFNLHEKVLLTADFSVIGGIKARDIAGSVITLDPVLDFNVKGEYMFSKRFSAFVAFKNIFAQQYQLLNRYPVKGFQVLAGVSYSF